MLPLNEAVSPTAIQVTGIVGAVLFAAGAFAMLSWVRLDASRREGVGGTGWMIAALFFPALVYYAVVVRYRTARTSPPTRLEHALGSVAIGVMGTQLLEMYVALAPQLTPLWALAPLAVATALSALTYAVLRRAHALRR